MEELFSQLISGVGMKLEAAQTVAAVAPNVISGTIKNIGEIPKAAAAFKNLASDVKNGKWSNLEDDASAVWSEFGTIVSNYGVNLGNLNALPKQMAKPAITEGEALS